MLPGRNVIRSLWHGAGRRRRPRTHTLAPRRRHSGGGGHAHRLLRLARAKATAARGLFLTGVAGASFGAAGLADVVRPPTLPAGPLRDARRWLEREVSPNVFPLLGPVVAANALVFLLWQKKHPPFRFLQKYFLNVPGSRRVLPLLLSTFSHMGVFHLGFNMYAFCSFAAPTVHVLGAGSTLGLFLTSGVVSSWGSSAVGHRLRGSLKPSLGASGAVLGLVSFVACHYPQAQVGMIFLPMVSMSAGQAIVGLAAIDTAGLLLGWRYLDHAAHLGGIVCGACFHELGGIDAVRWWQAKVRRQYARARHYWREKTRD